MASPLSPNLPWNLASKQWSQALSPIMANPLNGVIIIKNIPLIDGATTISHGLGRMMLGWTIVDIDGVAEIYRSQPMNAKTLTLTSTAAVNVNIGVF